eukprot:scaffold50185_cov59-Phaeocystis_antarctica.AAC.4
MHGHGHVRVKLVVHLGLDSHHWLLVTQPPLGVRVGGWHLFQQYQLLRGIGSVRAGGRVWKARRVRSYGRRSARGRQGARGGGECGRGGEEGWESNCATQGNARPPPRSSAAQAGA